MERLAGRYLRREAFIWCQENVFSLILCTNIKAICNPIYIFVIGVCAIHDKSCTNWYKIDTNSIPDFLLKNKGSFGERGLDSETREIKCRQFNVLAIKDETFLFVI